MLPSLDGENNKRKDGQKKNQNVSLPSFDMPAVEDDFKPLDVNEALYNEGDSENEEIYREANKTKEKEPSLPTVQDEDDYGYKSEEDYNPDYEEDLKKEKYEEENGTFINKKEKKIIPFGGKKSNKKMLVKSSDFDDRKNKLAKTKIMQFTIMAIVFLLFLFGLKNTFLPAHVYTDEQIRQFAAEGAGQTGFPAERGKSFVENFMEVYLTMGPEQPERLDLLSTFYGGSNFGTNNNREQLKMNVGADTTQKVLIGPTVFEEDLLSSYSAQYKVTSYVTSPEGEKASESKSSGRWVTFAVNLYYDEKTDSLAITPDSPIVIPVYKISEQSEVPSSLPLGNGKVNKDITPALTPTINGFVEAYAKSSLESHESILQYIDNKTDVKLLNGFGGSVVLDGSPNDAIEKIVYDADDGSYRVEVTVKWLDTASNGEFSSVRYSAKYMMKIVSISDGKYAVSSFVPYTYLKQ